MAVYVYKTADGSLVSCCPNDTDPVASAGQLAAKGLASVSGLAALDATHAWDAPSKTVIVVVAAKAVLTLIVFWQRFTATEREAIIGAYLTGTQAVKNKIGAFKDYLRDAGSVDLGDAYIQSCVQAMETAGVIAAGRAAQILA